MVPNVVPKEALQRLVAWARDLSEQSDSNALDYLQILRRGHCKPFNDAAELLDKLRELEECFATLCTTREKS